MMTATTGVIPHVVAIPEADLDDLRARLANIHGPGLVSDIRAFYRGLG